MVLAQLLDRNRQLTLHFLHPEQQYLLLMLLVQVLQTHMTLRLVHQLDLYQDLVLIRQQEDMLMLTSVLLDYLMDLKPIGHIM